LRNNSKIHLKDSNDKYIPPIKCYIHTVGTSDQKLQIQTQSKHHNSDFTIEIEQQDNQTMTLEEQVTNQILELNKLINPYQEPIHISASMTLRNSLTTLLNKTLTCDKIQIDLSYYSNSWGIYQGNIFALLDGEPVTSLVMAGSNPVRSTKTTIENVNGKQLTIKFGSNNTYTHSFFGFHLQEFTKKP